MLVITVLLQLPVLCAGEGIALNEKSDGYRGIWYQRQKLDSEYRYKYSGGLGTYCAKHQPFAIYRPEVNKTFFCYGGVLEDYHKWIETVLLVGDLESAQKACFSSSCFW